MVKIDQVPRNGTAFAVACLRWALARNYLQPAIHGGPAGHLTGNLRVHMASVAVALQLSTAQLSEVFQIL